MVPWVPIAFGLYSATHLGLDLYRAYGQRKVAQANLDYLSRQEKENKRFFDDYYKNTGIRPKYPVRSGASYNYGALYNAKWIADNWWISPAYSGASTLYSSTYLYR